MHFKPLKWSYNILVFALFCQVFTLSTLSFARDGEGGATSGGGHSDGLTVQQSLSAVASMLNSDTEVFTELQRSKLLQKAAIVKIIMVGSLPPVATSVGLQDGDAYSVFDGVSATMAVVQKRWNNISSPALRERLIFHELAVLAGLEATGDYHLSNVFADKRTQFWEKMLSSQIICSVSIFETVGSAKTLNLLGASAFVNNSVLDVRSAILPITSIERNETIVLRYVSSGTGYLRGVVSRATVSPGNALIFDRFYDNSNDIVFFSPYELVNGSRESSLHEWPGGLAMISCAKL